MWSDEDKRRTAMLETLENVAWVIVALLAAWAFLL